MTLRHACGFSALILSAALLGCDTPPTPPPPTTPSNLPPATPTALTPTIPVEPAPILPPAAPGTRVDVDRGNVDVDVKTPRGLDVDVNKTPGGGVNIDVDRRP